MNAVGMVQDVLEVAFNGVAVLAERDAERKLDEILLARRM